MLVVGMFMSVLDTSIVNVAGAQATADRSGLLGRYAADDPRVVGLQEQGPGGLLGLYQQMAGAAQTDADSQAFLVIGGLCLAGAGLAVLLRSGRPVRDPSNPVVAH